MKVEYKDYKGVLTLMVGETQNTLPYKDNNDLINLVERMLKLGENDMEIYDFEDKFLYIIYNNEDLEELKESIGVI